MSNMALRRIARPARRSVNGQTHPAVVAGCLTTFSDEQTPEIPWEAPTSEDWRRAALVIAKQVALHIAGYRDHAEFARDRCQFAWDIFETIQVTGRRGH
jgi:hypothetical protein